MALSSKARDAEPKAQSWPAITSRTGFAHEALGIIEVVEFTDLEAASAPEFVALKGAALVLAERGKAAQKALTDPRLDGYQDIFGLARRRLSHGRHRIGIEEFRCG